MFNKKRKGFTLIELLVVIAVIGVLATIVLVSLSAVQDRAKDTRMKASLSQIRSIAEMAATPLGNYADVCVAITADAVYKDLTAMNLDASPFCDDDNAGWCVHATLNNGETWCVDREKVAQGSCGGTPAITCAP